MVNQKSSIVIMVLTFGVLCLDVGKRWLYLPWQIETHIMLFCVTRRKVAMMTIVSIKLYYSSRALWLSIEPPLRIECFDISTIHGKHSVASMVVSTNGKPDKSQYRRFKIRMETDEATRFAMMSEVFERRYNRRKNEG